MATIYRNWYDYRGKETIHATRKEQLKAAYDYLKRYPTSRAVINCNKYVDGKQIGKELLAVTWEKVDGKRQIVVGLINTHYLLKSDGSKGKKLRKKYLYDSDGLIYSAIYFTE